MKCFTFLRALKQLPLLVTIVFFLNSIELARRGRLDQTSGKMTALELEMRQTRRFGSSARARITLM
jgi:hypothetical protein